MEASHHGAPVNLAKHSISDGNLQNGDRQVNLDAQLHSEPGSDDQPRHSNS